VASETELIDTAEVEEAAYEHAHLKYLHHHFDDLGQQRESTSLAMWLFLATEAMMFGGLFFAYTLYRWLYGGAYHAGSRELNILLGATNTLVLLISSLTMAMGVYSAATRNRRNLVLFLVITWLLGFTFLGIKAVEWTKDYNEGLIPAVRWDFFSREENRSVTQELAEHGVHPDHVKMYFVLYFCMTGLHALHMVAGLILVGAFIFLSAKGRFTDGNDQPVEIMGLYWHFVDIIWVFLFPLLYLIGGFTMDRMHL